MSDSGRGKFADTPDTLGVGKEVCSPSPCRHGHGSRQEEGSSCCQHSYAGPGRSRRNTLPGHVLLTKVGGGVQWSYPELFL